jgi:hypothetical protein
MGRCHVKIQLKQLQVNLNLARAAWGRLPINVRRGLEELTSRYSLSVALGDIQLLEGRWYVTHAGLLRLANRDRCSGIRVSRMRELCDASANRWVFRATVYKCPRSRGFVGYGDADPSNVSSLVHGAEMRVAETRAVNRALRKAYGIGLCSVEELGWHLDRALLARPNTPRLRRMEMTATRTASLGSGIACACSFVSTSSMPAS